jgi:osmoprotectant transport system ATP-binding protein
VVIFQKGGIIAQQGSPAQILANPASEFIASFVGADRGKRRLTISKTSSKEGELVLVDGNGNPAGVLSTQGGLLPSGTGPKSLPISDKTDQAGDA